MAKDRKEYYRAYEEAHKEKRKEKCRAYYKIHKEERKAKIMKYYKAHKEEIKVRRREYNQSHKEEIRAYRNSDVNSLGETKDSIRYKSRRYLKKYGKKIPGYEIHHCCTYNEPYKFIYCSKEMHNLIHSYLRQHNIDADSDHYDLIKHLLDETVVLYGIV